MEYTTKYFTNQIRYTIYMFWSI